MISEEKLLSTAEVGERVGVDEQTVRLWIKKGKLEALKVGRGWRIPQSALEEFLGNAPKAPAPPSPAEASEERRSLAERRLLSALHPFAEQVEARTEYWRRLAGSGRVSLDTLEYATKELGITAKGFRVLVDAAIDERWSRAELGLLRRVYASVAGPYREAWNALMTTWVASATDTQGSRRLRLVADADDATQVFEEAGEALRTAA